LRPWRLAGLDLLFPAGADAVAAAALRSDTAVAPCAAVNDDRAPATAGPVARVADKGSGAQGAPGSSGRAIGHPEQPDGADRRDAPAAPSAEDFSGAAPARPGTGSAPTATAAEGAQSPPDVRGGHLGPAATAASSTPQDGAAHGYGVPAASSSSATSATSGFAASSAARTESPVAAGVAPAPARPSEPQSPVEAEAPAEPPVSGASHLDGSAYWPAPWDGFWRKVARPSATVWTYFNLGLDMLGLEAGAAPSAQRRTLFRTLIRGLGWPPGSITFWPMAAPAAVGAAAPASQRTRRPAASGRAVVPAPAAEPDLFWRGVAEIEARFVLCFGARALATVYSGATHHVDLAAPSPDTGVYTVDGVTLLALPEPSELLRAGQEGAQAVVRALHTLVRPPGV
jgi:hypothetical protein